MAVPNIRDTIMDVIEEGSLSNFHKACATTDKLFEVMERTTDPEQAYGMCVAWANSILDLARIEVRLLSAVLPLYQVELDELVDQITPLIQRREDARAVVYDLRGPDHDVRPLSMKTDPARAREVKDAKASSKRVSMEVLAELRPIQADAEEIQSNIGVIGRSLRVLAHFAEHKFPIPQRTPRLRGQSTRPSGVDPISAFATKYVADMSNRGKVDAEAAALKRARAHPTNRYDRTGQEIAH